DGTVRIWETSSGRLLLALARHNGEAMAVAWSPEGRLVASAGADKLIHLLPLGDPAALPSPREALRRALAEHWLRIVRFEAEEDLPPAPASLEPMEAEP